MKTKKPNLKKLINEGIRDYLDQGNKPKKEPPIEEPPRFMTTEGLDVPKKIGEFTIAGDSFYFR